MPTVHLQEGRLREIIVDGIGRYSLQQVCDILNTYGLQLRTSAHNVVVTFLLVHGPIGASYLLGSFSKKLLVLPWRSCKVGATSVRKRSEFQRVDDHIVSSSVQVWQENIHPSS